MPPPEPLVGHVDRVVRRHVTKASTRLIERTDVEFQPTQGVRISEAFFGLDI